MKRRFGRPLRQVFILMLTWALLSGCNDSSGDITHRDGVYVGRSSEDDLGAYGEATLTIDDNEIIKSEYVTREYSVIKVDW